MLNYVECSPPLVCWLQAAAAPTALPIFVRQEMTATLSRGRNVISHLQYCFHLNPKHAFIVGRREYLSKHIQMWILCFSKKKLLMVICPRLVGMLLEICNSEWNKSLKLSQLDEYPARCRRICMDNHYIGMCTIYREMKENMVMSVTICISLTNAD